MSLYSPQSKLAAYRSVSAHGVAEADPHALVLTLFDAAIERMNAARACIERGELMRKASLLHSSVILIAELRGSLDLQRGGGLAPRRPCRQARVQPLELPPMPAITK